MKNGFSVVVLCITVFTVFSGCSLDYGSRTDSEKGTPELSFSSADFSRYEENKKTIQLKADRIEQYKDEDSSFAKNVRFMTWNSNGDVDTEGSCGLISANSASGQYNLFDTISVRLYGQNINLIAQNLRWDSKTEQLTSGEHTTVSIERDDVMMKGTGFSASGISKSFSFIGNVKGVITTSDNTEKQTSATRGETQK